jgi:hypothetical protein
MNDLLSTVTMTTQQRFHKIANHILKSRGINGLPKGTLVAIENTLGDCDGQFEISGQTEKVVLEMKLIKLVVGNKVVCHFGITTDNMVYVSTIDGQLELIHRGDYLKPNTLLGALSPMRFEMEVK